VCMCVVCVYVCGVCVCVWCVYVRGVCVCVCVWCVYVCGVFCVCGVCVCACVCEGAWRGTEFYLPTLLIANVIQHKTSDTDEGK
jgi:hypothetical protein